MRSPIPFNKPHLVGRELAYITDALDGGNAAGDGMFSERCCAILEQRLGGGKAFLTPSCTAALEIAALLCRFRPDDEVVVPAFAFPSTASAFVRAGARPVFVDIRPDTLNLDEHALEGALTARTRAIVALHYGGVACDMDRIGTLARAHDALVIEDAAHAIGASYRGRPLGSIGHLAGFSFHETKNVHCGQGGALSVNRPDDLRRAEILRDRGTNRQEFLRGAVDRYTWVDVGSAYVLSEIQAAYLCAQLEALDALTAARARAHAAYHERLRGLERRERLRLPIIPPECTSNHHIFHIMLSDGPTRDALLAFLHARSIHAVIHYVPLHTSPFGRSLGTPPALPVTDDVSARLLRLPLYHDLSETDLTRVTDAIEDFFDTR